MKDDDDKPQTMLLPDPIGDVYNKNNNNKQT